VWFSGKDTSLPIPGNHDVIASLEANSVEGDIIDKGD
jgi:hypothetical protein